MTDYKTINPIFKSKVSRISEDKASNPKVIDDGLTAFVQILSIVTPEDKSYMVESACMDYIRQYLDEIYNECKLSPEDQKSQTICKLIRDTWNKATGKTASDSMDLYQCINDIAFDYPRYSSNLVAAINRERNR